MVEKLHLAANDWVPNNPKMPAAIYRQVLPAAEPARMAAQFEAMFLKNGWPLQWRNGIFDFHHFHSTAHEVLGCASGWANVIVGGPKGREIVFVVGDVLLLPAGTGHCSFKSAPDFLVVGAYPSGQAFDICRKAPTSEQVNNIASLPPQTFDPVSGQALFQ